VHVDVVPMVLAQEVVVGPMVLAQEVVVGPMVLAQEVVASKLPMDVDQEVADKHNRASMQRLLLQSR